MSRTDDLLGELVWYTDDPTQKERIIELAQQTIIKKTGHPDISVIAKLKTKGFIVTPEKKDDYGWITGSIVTPTGQVILFPVE